MLVDAEALKRALANLVDNAAEAMQGSLLRHLTVETSLSEGQMAEIVIADTGHGLTPETRERLFLPYFFDQTARAQAWAFRLRRRSYRNTMERFGLNKILQKEPVLFSIYPSLKLHCPARAPRMEMGSMEARR